MSMQPEIFEPSEVSEDPEGGKLAGWQAVGASIAGVSHLQAGLPCQDALSYQLLPPAGGRSELLIAALADGAGSAEHSAKGAQTAVMQAVESLRFGLEAGLPEDDDGWRALLISAFAAARDAVVALPGGDPEGSEADPLIAARSYAATLACLVASEDLLAAATLGDSVIIARSAAGELSTVIRPQRGEYANETAFLTQEDALEMAQVEVLHAPLAGLAMLSDGLIRLALNFPGHAPFAPFFTPLFAFAASPDGAGPGAGEQLAAFLASERVNARTDDDKSLLLAVFQ